jgi:hypothetical protein
MYANTPLKILETAIGQQDATSTVGPLLVPADVAGPMCGRSKASWWRDNAAERIPAPVRVGGRTLWRVEELRLWVECGCPDRSCWNSLQRARRGCHE